MCSDSFDDLIKKNLPPVHSYIEPGFLPVGGKLLLCGQEKIGKSYVVMQMMKDLAMGKDLWGCPYFPIPNPVRVNYLEQELGEHELKKRVVSFFHSVPPNVLANLKYQSKNIALQLGDPTRAGIQALRNILCSDKPQVVVFDPLRQFHCVDENDSSKMAAVIREINYLSNENKNGNGSGHSTIIVHHENKPPFDVMTRKNVRREGTAAIRGSTAITADVDTIVMLEQVNEGANFRQLKASFSLRQMQNPGPITLIWNYQTMEVKWVPPNSSSAGNGLQVPGALPPMPV